ncbi:MAG: hypothetical protein IJN35_07340, partial [Muribaculaceae bacterium]|nr:hypothetical protein [Muribaculaceae bacterium]
MKKNIFPRFLVFTLMLLASSVFVWGQTEISFDISKGNVRLTDATYSGYNSGGAKLSGTHNPGN